MKIYSVKTDKEAALAKAIDYLSKGEAIALPTETVYGLAADATNGEAIARIYAIKSRPQFNPLIAHMSDIVMVERYCEINKKSRQLMERFWPGPLSLVLPLRKDFRNKEGQFFYEQIHSLATAGLETIAVRCPRGIFREIVQRFDRPLVAPSANRSGKLSPTSAQAVFEDLGAQLSLILDDGRCSIGVESTILKVQDQESCLIRPGGLERKILEEFLCQELKPLAHDHAIEAPGMLQSHYAPQAHIRLNAQEIKPGEAALLFGQQPIQNIHNAKYSLNLSRSADVKEAAMHLFAYLKELDKKDIIGIAVQKIANEGLGEAINDRLMRACAPRFE